MVTKFSSDWTEESKTEIVTSHSYGMLFDRVHFISFLIKIRYYQSVRHDMRPIASYNDADLFDLEPPPQSCASPQQVKKPSRQQVEEAIPQQQGEKASHTHIETQESKIETQPVVKPKPKNYKFSVIGDGYIYYLLQDMSGMCKASTFSTISNRL